MSQDMAPYRAELEVDAETNVPGLGRVRPTKVTYLHAPGGQNGALCVLQLLDMGLALPLDRSLPGPPKFVSVGPCEVALEQVDAYSKPGKVWLLVKGAPAPE